MREHLGFIRDALWLSIGKIYQSPCYLMLATLAGHDWLQGEKEDPQKEDMIEQEKEEYPPSFCRACARHSPWTTQGQIASRQRAGSTRQLL